MAKEVKDSKVLRKLKGFVDIFEPHEFPLKLSSKEQTMSRNVYAPIESKKSKEECLFCDTNMIIVTYKNNFDDTICLKICPECNHMEELNGTKVK